MPLTIRTRPRALQYAPEKRAELRPSAGGRARSHTAPANCSRPSPSCLSASESSRSLSARRHARTPPSQRDRRGTLLPHLHSFERPPEFAGRRGLQRVGSRSRASTTAHKTMGGFASLDGAGRQAVHARAVINCRSRLDGSSSVLPWRCVSRPTSLRWSEEGVAQSARGVGWPCESVALMTCASIRLRDRARRPRPLLGSGRQSVIE